MGKIKNWDRYDDETYHKQPHWQNRKTDHVVYISYNPNIGGYQSDKKWRTVWRETRNIESEYKTLGEFENRKDALERARDYIRHNPRG